MPRFRSLDLRQADLSQADLRQGLAGTLAVAATYTYFLLFAQFGFLHLLEQRLSAAAWRPSMAAMGLAGLVTSLLMAAAYRRFSASFWIQAGFLACGLSAMAALLCRTPLAFMAVAAAIGASTGLLTVALASGLRHLLPLRHLGLGVGLGTGLAYGLCNVPALFAGSPAVKIFAVTVACAVGFAAVRIAGIPGLSAADSEDHPSLDGSAFVGWGFLAIIASFLALIWLDSAAFLIIQETELWKSHTWGDSGRQLTLGICHFVAAVFAGWWIDRGGFRSILPAAWGCFVLAFTALQHSPLLADLTGPVYVLGISFYSTALVAFPSLGGELDGRITRHWRAAWIYGIGGWIGSALGVGMAQDLHAIPDLFLVLTGITLLATTALGLALSRRPKDQPWRRLSQAHSLTLIGFVVALVVYAWPMTVGTTTQPVNSQHLNEPASSIALAKATVDRGREIYIREGCIHCHSQYIRPVGDDLERYGPFRGIQRQDRPVLIGNRRQGPDLTWSGRFRDSAWLEKHLRNPRSTSPGSRMPPFDHLFQTTDAEALSDGDALVVYLASKRGPMAHPRQIAEVQEPSR